MAGELEKTGVEAKLDILIKLMAMSVAPPSVAIGQRAITLSKAGLTPKDIAALCDTTAHSVSQAVSSAKGKKKKKRKG